MPTSNDGGSADRWQEWEADYRGSGDVKYAVWALGKWGRTAPGWAFQACSAYFQAEERRSAGHYRNDDKLLDRMAELLTSQVDMKKHAAACMVTGDEVNGPNIRRLLRLWDDEHKTACPGIKKPELWTHPRYERAQVRLAKQSGNFLGPHNLYNVPPPDPEAD